MEHLQCGDGGFDALVAVLSAGAGAGLFHVVVGQDAEDGGAVRIHSGPEHAGGGRLTDVVKVGGLPANHAADGDDGVTPPMAKQPLASQRQFETAGDVVNEHVIHTGGLQDLQRSVPEGMGDFGIPSGHGETDAEGSAVLESVRIVGGQVVSFRGHPVRSDGRCEALGRGLRLEVG